MRCEFKLPIHVSIDHRISWNANLSESNTIGQSTVDHFISPRSPLDAVAFASFDVHRTF